MRRLAMRRGDTLVEVAIALSLLSLVLVSAFNVAGAAFRLGEAAKQRTQASNLIQEQAEALRNYRDSRAWAPFFSSTSGTFHMERASGGGWRVVSGNFTPSLNGQNTIYTVSIQRDAALSVGGRGVFYINAQWPQTAGSAPYTTTISYTLVNMDGLRPADRSAGR